jgi:hypothetical protein
MNVLLSLSIGVLSSIAASLIFLLSVSRVRPRIVISDKIARTVEADGKTAYIIKIINKSKRPAVNIRADLFLVTPKTIPGGMMLDSKEIPLRRTDPLAFYKYETKEEMKCAEGKYAFLFCTNTDLEAAWGNDSHTYLRFRIYCIDSLTGFGKLFTKIYYKPSIDIVNGEFQFGKLIIVPCSQ